MRIAGIRAGKSLIAALTASFGKIPEGTEHNFDSIGVYHNYKNKNTRNSRHIDSITWNDLEMDKVFERINACKSSVGEEYLYNCLHELRPDSAELLQTEEAADFFERNKDERLAAESCLSKLGKINYNGLATLIFNPSAFLLKFPFVYKALALLPILCAAAFIHSVATGIVGLFAAFAVNLIVHLVVKAKMDIELPAVSYFSAMLRCCKRLGKIENIAHLPVIQKIEKNLVKFRNIIGRIPTPAVKATVDFADYINILFLMDIRNYNKTVSAMIQHNAEFHALYAALGELDALISVLSFRKSLPHYCAPDFWDRNEVMFEEIFHPLINSPVTNSGNITNCTLLTGSNASGKSTFIKALAINGILAQTLFTCAAKAFKTRHSLVQTSMAARDNIVGGESYFVVEIKSLKRILDIASEVPCFCCIDEILRGTNTAERIAASAALLSHFRTMGILCVAATHDIELTRLLADKFDNFHFTEQVTDGGISFDYKLRNGRSESRNAIKLLDLMGFDKEIIRNAQLRL